MGGKGSGRTRLPREHGLAKTYGGGCRCQSCRRAWREFVADYRKRVRFSRNYYRDEPVATVVAPLSPLSCEILNAVEARTLKSRRDIVEHLLRLHGAALSFDEPVV